MNITQPGPPFATIDGPDDDTNSLRRPVAATIALALGTGGVGVSGHSVAGLLPSLTEQLHTSPAAAGQLGSLFALTCALSAPLLSAATSWWGRRQLLVVALLVTGGGGVVAAAAESYMVLAMGRVVTALGAATTTAVAIGIAMQINPAHRRGRAIATVLSGLTLSLAGGVPAANALAAGIGYRVVLLLIAALCVAAAIVIALVIPPVPVELAPSLRTRLSVLHDLRVFGVLASAALIWTSTFALYPYVTSLLDHYDGGRGVQLSMLLAAYGVGAVLGNLIGGAVVDRIGPRPALVAATAGASVALMLSIPVLERDVGGGPILLLALWGALSWSVNPPLNAWLAALVAPGQQPLVFALAGSAIYLGMGVGGIVGGIVLARYGVDDLPTAAATIASAASILLILSGLGSRRTEVTR